MSESEIKDAIAKAVSDENYELAAQLKSQLKAPSKAPPPPPSKAPPPPPRKAPPPTEGNPLPPPTPPSKEALRPPKKAPPKGKPKGKPKAKPKGKPKQKKGRRIKINLRLRQTKITDEEDTYSDQQGWTISAEEFDEPEEPINKEPEVITHQCSFCGAMMRIPKPTRDRYTVICPHPECGHEDKIGF
jgi:hypothetical protein